MAETKRKIVKINFVGTEKLEGKIFDTTIKEEAIKSGIFEENRNYAPLAIILGEKELHQKVEEVLGELKEGEKQVVQLTPEESFGERKTDLFRVVPLKNFHEQKIEPFPGLVVRVGNAIGRVQSVTSGRVRIDFNHPLAGRNVEYLVEVVKEITDKEEIMKTFFEKYYSKIPNSKKEINQNTLTITLPKNLLNNLDEINKSITKLASEFGVEIKFVGKEITPKEVELPESVLSEEQEEKEINAEKKSIEEKEIIEEKENIADKEKPKSIHQIADEEKQKTKKEFDVVSDGATIIQKPKNN